jgi:lysophospholipase L1-like esterase
MHADFAQLPSFNLGTAFSLYQDGVFDGQITGLAVDADSHRPGSMVTYEIVCPSYARVVLTGLQIEADSTLTPVPAECRPRYAAFGDSITHGFGQHPTSEDTYPWLLASIRRWELFNLAVSGSKVTPEIGAMLDAEPLDVVTILWGQNDWNSSNNLPLFVNRYGQLVSNIRAAHPRVGIYCITLTASVSEAPAVDNGYTRESYRQAVRDIVSERQADGDANLFVLEGLDLTTTDDLLDGIHLSREGAARFAERLAAAIPLPGPSGLFFDYDRDCDIDAGDLEHFRDCASGPELPLAPGCEEWDAERDNDVDQSDFGRLQCCFSGGGPIDRDCAH